MSPEATFPGASRGGVRWSASFSAVCPRPILVSDSPVRVRFAPSPTGLLHVGGLRTALYNFLLAKRTGGTFVLRIEDTDQGRFVPEAEADIAESLAWAGLVPDESPDAGGPHAPYRQSERTALYADAARRLLDGGHAYLAFDTPDEIESMRQRHTTPENPAPTYDASTRGEMANSLTLTPDEIQRRLDAGEPHVVRLWVTSGDAITFTDAIRGEVSFPTDRVDDQVLVKSDGLPTYHLANVVDDHAMGITHAIRGEEWLPSTPKHLLLYRALGFAPPVFAHLPLILSPTGGKLSKRAADRAGIPVSVRDYRVAGFEPEALVSFLALLGWNPGTEQEIFSLDDLNAQFSLERVGKTGGQFSMEKLTWTNGQVLRALPADEIARRARPAVEAALNDAVGAVDDARLTAAADLMRERLTFAHDLAGATYLFTEPTTYDDAGVAKRWKPDSADHMRAYADRLAALSAFDGAAAEAAMRAMADEAGVGFSALVHPARIAVTGVTVGAGLFETMDLLGRDTCVARLRRAADALG